MVSVQTTSPCTQRKSRILWFSGEKQDCKDKLLLTVGYITHYIADNRTMFLDVDVVFGFLNAFLLSAAAAGQERLKLLLGD